MALKEATIGHHEKELTQQLDHLYDQHQALLEKFYDAICDAYWSTSDEAKALVAETNLSEEDKQSLVSYFDQTDKIEKELDKQYEAFDKEVTEQNAQLEALTKEADAIYQKHGISKDALEVFYMGQDQLPAD
ncbi:hypothetical protein ACVRY6_06820 [Streptococcus ictaluri]